MDVECCVIRSVFGEFDLQEKGLEGKSHDERNVFEKSHDAVYWHRGVPGSLFATTFVGRGSQNRSQATSIGHGAAETTTEWTTAETEAAAAKEEDKTKSGYGDSGQFGGPKSVGVQFKTDDKVKEPLFTIEGFQRALKPYYGFKRRVKENFDNQQF